MFNSKIYKAYLESSKPRVVLLMIFTSFIGMLLADPLGFNIQVLILGNLGIALMSLSAGSINQLLDQKIDSIMHRTKKRPLLNNEDLNIAMNKIYKSRKIIYNLADYKILCDKINKPLVVEKILKIYEIYTYAF